MSVKKLPSLVFSAGEYVVCPGNGVGKIVGLSKEKYNNSEYECLVVDFSKYKGKTDNLCNKYPTYRIASSGLRKISDEKTVNKALEVLKGKGKGKWSRNKDEYGRKANSGDIIAIAEVVRDLYRGENAGECSMGERDTYEKALGRLKEEISVCNNCSMEEVNKQLEDILSKARSTQTPQS